VLLQGYRIVQWYWASAGFTCSTGVVQLYGRGTCLQGSSSTSVQGYINTTCVQCVHE